MNDKIDIFIKKIKEEYPEIYISYDFLEDDNTYEIWYNNKELRKDLSFQSFVGKLIKEYLHDDNIFNFFIDYNEEKSNQLDEENNFVYFNSVSVASSAFNSEAKLSTSVSVSVFYSVAQISQDLASSFIKCYAHTPEQVKENLSTKVDVCTAGFYEEKKENSLNNKSLPLAA